MQGLVFYSINPKHRQQLFKLFGLLIKIRCSQFAKTLNVNTSSTSRWFVHSDPFPRAKSVQLFTTADHITLVILIVVMVSCNGACCFDALVNRMHCTHSTPSYIHLPQFVIHSKQADLQLYSKWKGAWCCKKEVLLLRCLGIS